MITKNYIKMCENEEIQKAWKPKIGDWYVDSEGDVECVSLMGEEIIKSFPKYFIYLPTIELLFKMAFKANEKNRVQLHYGINECDERKYQLEVSQIDPQDPNYEEEYISDSIQGCLLQHIYKIKYNKIWTGQKWVKAE